MPIIDPERLLEAVEEQMFGTENPGFCIDKDISGIIIKKAPVYKKAPPYLSKISNELAQK